MFNKIKEIKSKDGVLHFRRWNIITIFNFRIYLHAIYKADEDAHLHNHPWNFINIVLKGSYTERLPNSKLVPKFPVMICKRTRDQFHKIEDVHTPVVYTLNFMWGKYKEWGYSVNGKFVDRETYRKMKNGGQL